jgi:hypothetical protein
MPCRDPLPRREVIPTRRQHGLSCDPTEQTVHANLEKSSEHGRSRDMTDRHDDLKRILAEGMEREAGLKNTLRQVMDRYPDATAAEIADAMRPVNKEASDTGRPSGRYAKPYNGSPR